MPRVPVTLRRGRGGGSGGPKADPRLVGPAAFGHMGMPMPDAGGRYDNNRLA